MPDPEEQKGEPAQTREQFSSRLKLMRFKRDVFGATIKAAKDLSMEVAEVPLELVERDKVGIFKARCAELSSVYTNFQVHQDQIVEFCHRSGQLDVLRLDVERAREVESEYYQTLAVRDLIEAKQESRAEERPIAVHHSPSSQRCSLPKIKIPQFSGEFTDWEAFRDLFKSIVHDRDISPTEKFSYLKTALSGDALALISSVPFGTAYYPVTWKELSEYFDNPKLLTFNYVDKLLGFPPIAEASLHNLQNFVTTFSEVYASLKTSAGCPEFGS
ncbi:hypothetical protein J437_LFUL011314 [Ladona fulva]|uniref:Uncharacterized protein n=1 Tax=Ladona fulva TaxID=123851 RepID=A0A8K0P0I6_LADFU|nr:hypothetical protein J437_LFUL011314 [Ladona fulva]